MPLTLSVSRAHFSTHCCSALFKYANAPMRFPRAPRSSPPGGIFVAQDISREINEAMGRSYEVPEDLDEADLMAELDGLEAELGAEEAEGGKEGAVPSYLQVSLGKAGRGCASRVGGCGGVRKAVRTPKMVREAT
jgi:hypothetical protein